MEKTLLFTSLFFFTVAHAQTYVQWLQKATRAYQGKQYIIAANDYLKANDLAEFKAVKENGTMTRPASSLNHSSIYEIASNLVGAISSY